VLIWPLESVLDLDPFDPLLLKNSKDGLLPTLSSREGLKRPDKLDISPPSFREPFKPAAEPFVTGNCWLVRLSGLIVFLSTGLAWDFVVGDAVRLAPVRMDDEAVGDGPGRRPKVGNSNWKLTSLGLLAPRPLPVR
jgi:hypothetical protein